MLFRSKTVAAAGLALLLGAHSALAQASASFNDVARYIAGLPLAADSPLAKYTRDGGWQQHAQHFDAAWAKLEKQQLGNIRAWSSANLSDRDRTLFYMFSGPDFLYAEAFFPHASTYVLAGLEPLGGVPEINERTRHGIASVRASLNTILNISYFITSDMQSRLYGGALPGTVPILYVFLARSGKTIHEVSLVEIDREGGIRPTDSAQPNHPARGVKIVFSGGGGGHQTLYYFRTDLSDPAANNSGFLKFLGTLGQGSGLVKSASYLLHHGGFSSVRNFLLSHVRTLVQDDTGIPVTSFKPDEWDLRPFGAYLGPIEIFRGQYQPKLMELFKRGNPPPLTFGIGYRWRGHDSNLLLAVRKKPVALGQ